MSENREEILADFQACTGIDDVAQAIYYLDESNWDLVGAVNRVMPQDQFSSTSTNDADVQIVEDVRQEPSTPMDVVPVINNAHETVDQNSQPSTSSNRIRKRLLHFSVHFQDRIIQLEIPDTGTVGELKIMLHAQSGIAPCQQLLSGWTRVPQSETVPLATLSLPRENMLFLIPSSNNDGVTADEEPNTSDRLTATYTLKVTDETTSKKYSLKYPGTRTILDVKNDVFNLTDIPRRHQIWTGWPAGAEDQKMLALAGISLPSHDLTVKKSVITGNPLREKKNVVVDLVDSDASSVEEFEDASESFNVEDDMFIDNLGSKKMEPLIPENIDDETIGCIHFSEQFTTRYGPVHPTFFTGTLDDAIKEACQKPAKDRKILAMYLHHDQSVLSNVFCTQLLGFESVMQMLENNFVLWGWDLTYETNRVRLLNSMTRTLGSVAAVTVRNIPTDKLPAILLIMKIRSSTNIYSVIYGNVSVNELLLRLVDAVDVSSGHQWVEVREEEERAAREAVKWEQDQAYKESLEADRAKEEAKRQQVQLETETRKRVESEKAEEEAKKERYRLEVEASLPPEPPEGSGDSMTKIRFRLPKGENLERRFTTDTKLKVLLDYLVVKGYPMTEYKVISSWPRRDLTSLDSNKTLQELHLCPQETVILEER